LEGIGSFLAHFSKHSGEGCPGICPWATQSGVATDILRYATVLPRRPRLAASRWAALCCPAACCCSWLLLALAQPSLAQPSLLLPIPLAPTHHRERLQSSVSVSLHSNLDLDFPFSLLLLLFPSSRASRPATPHPACSQSPSCRPCSSGRFCLYQSGSQARTPHRSDSTRPDHCACALVSRKLRLDPSPYSPVAQNAIELSTGTQKA
jgi:hypothetical protein